MSTAYLLTVEGIPGPGSSEQARYCYNELPEYAQLLDHYVPGLAEPPSGVSGKWELPKSNVTGGRWTVLLRPDIGRHPWYLTRPRAVSELRQRITAGATTIDHRRTNGAAGIEVGVPVYCGRETLWPTEADPDETFFEADRGVAGSRAAAHAQGADLYLSPPALIGRRVVFYAVSQDADDAGDERQLITGYIGSDPTANIHSVSITVRDRLNWRLQASRDYPTRTVWEPGRTWPSVVTIAPGDVAPEPILTTASGGYWYFPRLGIIYPASYGGTGVLQRWTVDTTRPIDVPERPEDPAATFARQVLISDVDLPYPIGPSDHPFDLFLYLLLTRDGTGGDYDLGADVALYPKFSLGLDPSEVDIESFQDAKRRLPGVRAQRLFLGVKEQTVDELGAQLLGPLRWGVGCGRDGRWRAVRIGDVYPGAATVTLDLLIRPAEWEHQTWSRPLDRMDVYVDPRAEGDGLVHHVVREEELRDLYPEQLGGSEEWKRLPYASSQWDSPTAPCVPPAIEGVARMSGKLALVKVTVGRGATGEGESEAPLVERLEVGTPVILRDSALRNPTTGQKSGVGA